MIDNSISENEKSLAIMAHDIKAPLTTIVSLLRVIQKGYVTDMDKALEIVERAIHKAETLVAMVDDILDYTLLSDKTMMKRERIDLFAVLNDTISTMKPYVDSRKMTLITPKLCDKKFLLGNYTFMVRVFNNLVMNAIKYNKEKGKIIIECRELPEKNSIMVSVSDTGIGIPEEDLSKVFRIFERGRNARKNLNGSLGLGLSLVKQIVDDHDGEIQLTSTVDVGTTIHVILPLLKEKMEEPMNHKILVVDDDIDVLETRKIVLEHNNYNVVTATNIRVAKEILEKDKIDLIILDVMMEKDSDGFTFAQDIKNDDRFAQIPIIMATAVNQRTKFKFDIEKDGDFLPVEKFMEKPIDPDDLIATIHGLLK